MKLFRIFIIVLLFANTLFLRASLVDANGSSFVFDKALERVACISPSVTELIYAIGAGDKIIANSRYCRFPKEATEKIKIGGYIDPDFEKIAEIKPDLFILTEAKNDIFTSKLDKFKISHLSLYSDGLENISKNIAILGEVFQKQKEARLLIEKIKNVIEDTKIKAKSLKKKRAIIFFGQMAAGKGSYVGELLEIAGFDNIMSESTSSWIAPEKEHILISAPEVIILESKSPSDFQEQRRFYLKDSFWKNTPAVKNNKIYPINSDLISIPCSHIMGALELLSAILQDSN